LPQLEARTQSDYQKVLDWLKPLHCMELSKWTRGFAIRLRDKALEKKGRRFANYVISVVQAVFTWALERELVDELLLLLDRVIHWLGLSLECAQDLAALGVMRKRAT
jgi:hypothetical protein